MEERKIDGCSRGCGSEAIKKIIQDIVKNECGPLCGAPVERDLKTCIGCPFNYTLTWLEQVVKEAEKS